MMFIPMSMGRDKSKQYTNSDRSLSPQVMWSFVSSLNIHMHTEEKCLSYRKFIQVAIKDPVSITDINYMTSEWTRLILRTYHIGQKLTRYEHNSKYYEIPNLQILKLR